MAKKHRNGRISRDFGQRAAPWGDKLPRLQPLPDDVDINQFLEDLDFAQNAGKYNESRLTRPSFIKIATAFREDAEKVKPVMEFIFHFVRNFAENDILRAKGTAIVHEMSNGNGHGRKIAREDNSYDMPKFFYRPGDTKTARRIIKKALDEYDGEFQKIRDIGRDTYEGNTREEIAALCVVMEWLHKSQYPLPGGARIIDVDNRFRVGTGTRYRSFKAIAAIPIPGDEARFHLAEIMITHGKFEKDIKINRRNKLKLDSHDTYERTRFIEERYQHEAIPHDLVKTYRRCWNIVADIHDSAAEKNDIARPLDFKTFENIRAKALQTTLEPAGMSHD